MCQIQATASVALGRTKPCVAKFRYAIQAAQTKTKGMPMLLELNPEKVRFIIVQMRKLDELSDAPMDDTSNSTDDGFAFQFT
jgi:hypothetical protein